MTTTASSSPAPTWITPCRAPTTRRASRSRSHPVPAKTNPLGVKGCGEAGCAGSLPAVMNAVVDALSAYRHPPHRHAGDARARLAGDPGGARMITRDRADRREARTRGRVRGGRRQGGADLPARQGLQRASSSSARSRSRGAIACSSRWETVENHTVDFRGSADFAEWRKLVGHCFDDPARGRACATAMLGF